MHWKILAHRYFPSNACQVSCRKRHKLKFNASSFLQPAVSFSTDHSCSSESSSRHEPNSEFNDTPDPLWFKSKLRKLGEDKEAVNRLKIPPWRQPIGENHRQCKSLYLMNSLTRKKERFMPENGSRVNWYMCGPTVYDSAHMGHARSYVAFDIVRRVMQDYFGYDVNYVMNITDIDDKIIRRARERYLIERYLREDRAASKILEDVEAAVKLLKTKFDAETNPEKRDVYESQITRLNEATAKFTKSNPSKSRAQRLLTEAHDALAEWLDAQYGHSITDHSMFKSLARQYETEFFQDMASLHVRVPDIVTRVSEYVPEIISFVQRIMHNGFAYEVNGSVYFDTAAFSNSGEYYFAKLMPEIMEDVEESRATMREGEGELSMVEHAQDKRSPIDFALWKTSKPGEPSWDSPWGKGRPGWHIECSAMASLVCGSILDIHSGGFDLKCPHHNNELAQSEAYFQKDQWVNYFLHSGTLHIAGLKMSKSLKNFITIKDALKEYTPRQLRLFFVQRRWDEQLEFNHAIMAGTLQVEKTFNEFFLAVKFYLRNFKKDQSHSYSKFGPAESELNDNFKKAKQAVDEALCDSINLEMAMDAVREIVTRCNAYISTVSQNRMSPNLLILRQIAMYVTRILTIFGVLDEKEEIGYADQADQVDDVDRQQLAMPYLEALHKFREQVRRVAKEKKLTEVLEECDRVRDI